MSASVQVQVQIVRMLLSRKLQLKMPQKSKQKRIAFQLKIHGPTMDLLLFTQPLANLNNNYLNPHLL